MSARILVVDNYDSFVFNLVQYLYQLGAECEVAAQRRGRTARTPRTASTACCSPRAPARPSRPVSASRWCGTARTTGVPVFGVCLGMQSMAVAYGGVVDRAPELLHGKTSLVTHEGDGVFAGLPSPFTATRYHSLAAEPATVPDELEVTARTRRAASSWACGTANCPSRACSSTPSRY